MHFFLLLSFSAWIVSQTFPGFQPSTLRPLILSWSGTVQNSSGQAPPPSSLSTLPTIGLDSARNGSYLLIMVDPDAIDGNIETEDGLHTIQGNYTCAEQGTSIGNTTFFALTTNSTPLAPFVPPEPQPQSRPWLHRYTLLLFQQPRLFEVPVAFQYALPLNASNIYNRLNFSIDAFAHAIDTPLIAASHFDILGTQSSITSPSATQTPTGSTSASATTSSSGSSRHLAPFSVHVLLESAFLCILVF